MTTKAEQLKARAGSAMRRFEESRREAFAEIAREEGRRAYREASAAA